MALLGNLFSAGASLLGGMFDRGERRDAVSSTERWNQRGEAWAREQYDRAQAERARFLQDRVADARKAGLHPLFALGAGGPNVGSTSFVAGQHPSGSGLGSGIAEAGRAMASATGPGKRMAAKHEALLDAQIREANARADWTSEQARASALKRSEQAVMTSGVAPEFPITKKALAPVPLAKRPWESTKRLSIPEKIRIEQDDGRHVPGLNPDAGLDEVGQVYYIYQKARQAVSDWLLENIYPATHGRNWRKR